MFLGENSSILLILLLDVLRLLSREAGLDYVILPLVAPGVMS